MNKSRNKIPIGFTKEHFPESCHVCLIYENEQQRQKIVSEYIAAGLKQGEVVRYFTDKTSPETVRSWIAELGVELSQAEENGSFSISKAERAYCPEGQFDPQEMINRSLQRYDLAKKAGYPGSRACGEMSWVLNGIPGSERILEYEVLLNTINEAFPHTGMCQYDARLFDGATLLKVLQVHPYLIAQGQVVQNPYYIRPEDFHAEPKKKL
jgi:hypothetical protein